MRKIRFLPRALAAALPCLLFTALPTHSADSLDSVEEAAVHWARLRSETARLETDWSWEREVLQSTRTALQERVKLLQEKRRLLDTRTQADRTELTELKQRAEDGANALREVEGKIDGLCKRVLDLRNALPPRLSQALDLPFRSLSDSSLPFAQRAQHLMSVLNRCALFNRSITVNEEVVSIPGSKDTRMLEVIYWGLSHAYALDRSNQRAYVGRPTPSGWAWQENAAITESVDTVIRVHAGRLDPRVIELPIQISAMDTATGQPSTGI